MPSLAIQAQWIITGRADEPWFESGHVVVVDGVIQSIGRGSVTQQVDEIIDAGDMILAPGFVNGHTHLCMSLGRSLGSDSSLLGWLTEAQLPLMSAFEPEDYALAVTLGALENLKAGNTTVCEVFFSNRLGDGADHLSALALDQFGLRSILFRCSNDLPFAPGFVETPDEIARRSRELAARWEHSALTQIGAGPLVPWSASPEYWQQTKEFLDDGWRMHLHTAETPEYNDLVRQQTGLSNVEMLADVGVLGPSTMLNHCVHLSETDIGLIAEHGSPVVHDPTSNMLLASGVAPVLALRDAGVTLGLACDGPACNNTQDMFEVMKDASLLQKVVTGEAGALTAADVFRMATRGGAEAAGLGAVTGQLAEGYAADLILVDTRSPHLRPIHDPLSTLVYSARASDVHTVLVGGRVVLQDRQVPGFDERELLAVVQERAVALQKRASEQ